MFTEKDFQKYFEQMESIEDTMIKLTSELEQYFKDKQIIDSLKEIHKDELKHRKLVEDMASSATA